MYCSPYMFPAIHPVSLYHLGVIPGVLFPLHVSCYPPCPIVPFRSYPRCTVPHTCSLLSTLFHCTIWELSQVYCSPYMFPAAIHLVPLYHLRVIPGVLFPLHVPCSYPPCPIVPFESYPRCTVPPTCSLLSTLSHCTIWEFAVPPTCSLLSTLSHCTIWELSQVYCSPYMFPAIHPVPLYHLGVISGVLFPKMTHQYRGSILRLDIGQNPFICTQWLILGDIHVPCYPPCPIVPFGSYLRCTVPPTCFLLSTLSHCTIWELSQVYYSPYMFPAIHLVPLYHLGVIPGVLFPIHVPCYPPCFIVPFGSYPRCTVPHTCSLLSTLSHCTIWDFPRCTIPLACPSRPIVPAVLSTQICNLLMI